MEKKIIIEHLKEVSMLKDLGEQERGFLADHVEVRHFTPGEFLFEEGMPREYFYVMCEGKLEIFKKNPFGEEKRLALIGEHEFIGEGALIEDLPHTTSARVLNRSVIMVFKEEDASEFLRTHPITGGRIIMRLSRFLSRRMRMTSVRASNVASQYFSGRTRLEHDVLGERDIPFECYFGIQTFRALENFYISGISISHYPELIEALAMIKMAAVKANYELGLLPKSITDAIILACKEILTGRLRNDFVVDLIQGGAGTSTNMNANEVIANRALEILGHKKAEYQYCHPNDHLNLSQSTNDVYPSALKLACIKCNSKMMTMLHDLVASFRSKGAEFANVIKMGRTQLQDAVPVTLGQEFEAYAVALEAEIERFEVASRLLLRLNMGGTAIGTGINSDPEYREKVISHLRDISGLEVRLDSNLIAATQDTGPFVTYS